MSAHTQDVFDPSAYPRTYGLSVAGKWMVSVLGLVMVSLSLGGAIYFPLSHEARTPAGPAVLFAVCGVFALMGIYLLAVVIFYRVILQADSIEVFEIYRRRYLSRGEIAGRGHFSYGQGMSAWVLVPKQGCLATNARARRRRLRRSATRRRLCGRTRQTPSQQRKQLLAKLER